MEIFANLLLGAAGLLALLALILGATGNSPDGRTPLRVWWLLPLAVLLIALAIAMGATPFLAGK